MNADTTVSTSTSATSRAVAAATLASLPRQTPGRLRRLIAAGDPEDVLHRVIHGDSVVSSLPDDIRRLWSHVAPLRLREISDRYETAGVSVVVHGDEGYPAALAHDPVAPAVLFVRGDLGVLHQRRVAIIGTRHATQRGRWLARRWGRELAELGVCVVSGLARGIDAHAHVGVLDASHDMACGPAGVVASGLDVPYPAEHRQLWARVAEHGVLMSESPPGTAPEQHRFPLRNRILAGLAEVVVVVESRARGGSMITVREAMKRDVAVLAVPGSPEAPTSEGTNVLLRDGCAPVLDVTDIITALGLDTRRMHGAHDVRVRPEGDEIAVLSELQHAPQSIDTLVMRTGRDALSLAVLLGRLEAKQWVAHVDGWWEALVGPATTQSRHNTAR